MVSEEEKGPKQMEEDQEHQNGVVNGGGTTAEEEHEEALLALVESRAREVESLRYHITYYTSQLEKAEQKFRDAESKLARFRGGARTNATSTSALHEKLSKTEHESSNGSIHKNEGSSSRNHLQFNPEERRLIPAATSSKISQSTRLPGSHSSAKASIALKSLAKPLVKSVKPQRLSSSPELEIIETKGTGRTKRKIEQKEHQELIPLICKSSSPSSVKYQKSCHILSQHKKRLRSIALCPVNDQRFATSALDGVVNLWEVQSRGSGASLLCTADCLSPEKRWPEDIAWHPDGNRLFSVYSADGQDSQISVTNFEVGGKGKAHVEFLEDKPHVKSVINNIVFLPWENTSFVTGGTDHAVMLWSENGENKWKPKPLHSDHSSAVMGVAGMQQKQIVLSAGKDKRILGYDANVGKQDFKHQVDSKCLSVLPNPCDFNLFMVQTGTPEKQLRLFDIRSKKTELHAFGWKQSSSESQSALVNQAWSPSGMYITSGSADPVIHIFDIRYKGHEPSQSIQAHKRRVFRAMWLQFVPLLISISSDLSIGLHKLE